MSYLLSVYLLLKITRKKKKKYANFLIFVRKYNKYLISEKVSSVHLFGNWILWKIRFECSIFHLFSVDPPPKAKQKQNKEKEKMAVNEIHVRYRVDVSLCYSANSGMSMCRCKLKNDARELVPTSPAVPRMSYSSCLDIFEKGGKWPCSCWFLCFCLQYLFRTACSIFV